MAGKPAATVGSNHTCPMCSGSTPHVGGPIIQGSPNIFINGQSVATLGSICTCNSGPDTIVTGISSVLINGKPIATIGDKTAHGGKVVTGSPNVIISSSSQTATSVMPIDKIPFPEISISDRLQAASIGQAKNLKQAEAIQKELRALAEQQEDKVKKLPKLQGEIIFVNGYLSDPVTNSESQWNAIMDLNPDKKGWFTRRGENVNERNRIDHDDFYTANQREEDLHKSKARKILEEKLRNLNTNVFSTPETKYYGYWNIKANQKKATEIYAKYFNAEGRVHYVNGSHGLASNGAHRVDHGISLGYEWARYHWDIYKKTNVDNKKGEKPQIESHTPHYKPVTIVGHSQGACMAAGVKIGVIKFASEMGYDKVAINSIFLGVHQPRGLYGDAYNSLVRKKTQEYMINKNAVLLGKEENSGKEFFNAISDLYNPKYKKIYNNRGLFEHVKTICGNWEDFKSRAVQFTFTNDRADLVSIDGDIPEINSACNPKIDKTLFSAEYLHRASSIPSYYTNSQNKKIIDLKTMGAESGFLVIPPYVANRRFDFSDVDDDSSFQEKEEGKEWGTYKDVAVLWAVAMNAFRIAKSNYEKHSKHKFDSDAVGAILLGSNAYIGRNETRIKAYQDLITNFGSSPRDKMLYELYTAYRYIPVIHPPHIRRSNGLNDHEIKSLIYYNIAQLTYQNMLLRYAALQTADLYAHFSPVAMITHKKLLSDFPADDYGKASIFDRITKAGENTFYRMEYKGNGKEIEDLNDKEKREQENEDVNGQLSSKLINSSIAETDYINNVIQAYVYKKKANKKQLYDETQHKP